MHAYIVILQPSMKNLHWVDPETFQATHGVFALEIEHLHWNEKTGGDLIFHVKAIAENHIPSFERWVNRGFHAA